MADKKISALTGATTPLAGTEVLPIVQGGATVKVSVADLTAGRAVGFAGGTFTDNFIQGTAAKGVNFTANTPAAGMTSQLLNWYEEGAWTPSDQSGAGLSLTIGAATYTRKGREVTCFAWITYPATGSGLAMKLGGIPFAAKSTNDGAGVSQYCSAGFQLFLRPDSTTDFVSVKNDNSSITNANLSGALIGIHLTYFV